jgi:hypothetical protein
MDYRYTSDPELAELLAEMELLTPDPLLAPWRLRINRVLRVMLHTRWSAEAWLVVRVEFRRALALRGEIRRAGSFNYR